MDFGGALAGLVFTGTLARIPAGDRLGLRLGQVALAVPPACRDAPSDPAWPVAQTAAITREVAVVVLDQAGWPTWSPRVISAWRCGGPS